MAEKCPIEEAWQSSSDKCICGHARWVHGAYIPDHCKNILCGCPFFRIKEREEEHGRI